MSYPETIPALSARSGEPGVPTLTLEDVRAAQQAGFSRIGVVAAFFHEGRLLSARHRPEASRGKISAATSWGPVSETVMGWREKNGHLTVESVPDTLARASVEEIGNHIGDLPLSYGSTVECPTTEWPVGYATGRRLLAVTAILYFDSDFDPERFMHEYTPTLEVNELQFLTPDEFRARGLRPGAEHWLDTIEEHGLAYPTKALARAVLPATGPAQPGFDLELDKITL